MSATYYLVTFADRDTGEHQRCIVKDLSDNTQNMQEWVDSKADDPHVFTPPLKINNPVVLSVHKLPVKRPHVTVFPTATKAAV